MYPKILEVLIAVGLIVAAWLYAGHRAVSEYKESQKLEQAEATKKQQDKFDELAGKYETLRDKRAENARTIIKEVEKVVDRPVYRTNCVDADGLFYANQALAGKGPASFDANVPNPDTP